jgi:methionine sulfoxide reductase heme-binding subunit
MFRTFLKPSVFVLSLIPLAWLVWQTYTGNLSANPIDDITDTTGTWTLRFLLISLSVTPILALTGWSPIGSLRRMLGLFAFFYAVLHFLTFIWLDKFFDIGDALDDVAKRPFITVGVISFLILIPLAATSTNRILRWMGGKRWKRLHRMVYLAAIGGVIHYLWLVKADLRRPLTYGCVLALLLGYRIWFAIRKSRLTARRSSAP